ncbi:hypothetical protein [Nostoc sp. FACHB-888]|uniref:hypothetical protein n=1 Tax=Nostoc sp. FACHB-888 TaxID=2692842 RepID=UPI001686D8EA|nr:hypothetical protein [Nostoc sp. FACHB-888]MBD2248987.1 hypothetical protein [Nostoc sp. FACHB-888]
MYYLFIRSQKRKTVLSYSHEERSDRLILASVQQIMLGHLPEKDIYVQLINSYNLGLVFSIDLVYLVNSVQLLIPNFWQLYSDKF